MAQHYLEAYTVNLHPFLTITGTYMLTLLGRDAVNTYSKRALHLFQMLSHTCNSISHIALGDIHKAREGDTLKSMQVQEKLWLIKQEPLTPKCTQPEQNN